MTPVSYTHLDVYKRQYVFNKSNADGMAHTVDYAARDFHGLCFVNLVDFDMLYGHRRDICLLYTSRCV